MHKHKHTNKHTNKHKTHNQTHKHSHKHKHKKILTIFMSEVVNGTRSGVLDRLVNLRGQELWYNNEVVKVGIVVALQGLGEHIEVVWEMEKKQKEQEREKVIQRKENKSDVKRARKQVVEQFKAKGGRWWGEWKTKQRMKQKGQNEKRTR